MKRRQQLTSSPERERGVPRDPTRATALSATLTKQYGFDRPPDGIPRLPGAHALFDAVADLRDLRSVLEHRSRGIDSCSRQRRVGRSGRRSGVDRGFDQLRVQGPFDWFEPELAWLPVFSVEAWKGQNVSVESESPEPLLGRSKHSSPRRTRWLQR